MTRALVRPAVGPAHQPGRQHGRLTGGGAHDAVWHQILVLETELATRAADFLASVCRNKSEKNT